MPSELGSGRPVGLSELQLEDVAVILGSLGGFLLVVAALVAYCYCHTNRRRKQQSEKDVEVTSGNAGMVGVGISGSGNGFGGGSSIMVKSGSMIAEANARRGSHESLDSVVKDTPESIPDGRPLSPVQSWGATTLLQEHERRLSIHSGAPEDSQLPAYPTGAPLHAPFPDVTVTDYRPVPTTRVAGEGQNYLPCSHDDNPCPCAGPGTDYTSYTSTWDEALTGHLLSRVRTHATPPPPIQPIPQQQQQQQIHPQQSDRKRRNVTQV